jgi:hypothetical protein
MSTIKGPKFQCDMGSGHALGAERIPISHCLSVHVNMIPMGKEAPLAGRLEPICRMTPQKQHSTSKMR